MLGLASTIKEVTGKFVETAKRKNGKAHVKKSAALLNIYCFTSTFQGISLGLKQFLLLFIKTSFLNTILLKINLYIQKVSSFSYLLLDFSPVKRWEKTNSLEREHEIICFMFRNNFFYENTVGESEVSSLLQKERRGSAKSDISKCYFKT